MKKNSVFCALLMLVLSVFQVQAEKGAMTLYGPDLLQVTAISPNGKWACGVVGDGSSILQGLLWNLESGEYTYLSVTDESSAWDVTDDGMVVGSFTDYTATSNGAPVSVAGWYKDGAWHRFDNTTIEEVGLESLAYGVSADGRNVAGYAISNQGDFLPVKWVDGKLSIIYKHINDGICYTISEDGKHAAGWSYFPDIDGDLNRAITYWNDTDSLILSKIPTAFESGRKFSPDAKLLLCEAHGKKFIYNFDTKERVELPFLTGYACWSQEMVYINNDGFVMGGETSQDEMTGASDQFGYVFENGVAMRMDEWLKKTHNVELDKNKAKLFRGVDMSSDQKVIAGLVYVLSNGIPTGAHTSVIIKIDQEITYCVPTALRAEKLRGLNSVRLTWNAPLMNAENVLGYNVYRENTKINEGVTENSCMDNLSESGRYTYSVTALYENGDGEIVESEFSQSVTIDVVAEKPNMVKNLDSHQVGYDGLKLRWEAPNSNLPSTSFYDENSLIAGFGGGTESFSVAIRLPYDVVANYAEKFGICRVAFMPRDAAAGYTIKIYIDNKERYSQQLSTETLKMGEMNIIDLTSPVRFESGSVVYVAVDIDASNLTPTSNNVIGMSFGQLTEGYSDLMRTLAEPNYYSFNRTSIEAGMGEMPVSWIISAIYAPVDNDGNVDIKNDMVAGYDIYRNNAKVATTTETVFEEKSLAAGNYNYGVVVNYADGSASEMSQIEVAYEPNKESFAPAGGVYAWGESEFVNVTWKAPLNNDQNFITYSNNIPSRGLTVSTSDLVEYIVAVDYPYDYINWYEGYWIKSLRFYPTSEAVFMLIFEVNGAEQETILLGEAGAEDGYVLNQWNEVRLSAPVTIKNGDTYRLKLVCSEVDPTTYPICLDTSYGIPGVSDLFSFDDIKWVSTVNNYDIAGNWMLGMVICNSNNEPMAVNGYNVYIDGNKVNTELVKETSYKHEGVNFKDGSTHRVKVNVEYPVADGTYEVEGQVFYYQVSPDAVESVEIDRVKVYPNPATSYIRVEGEVEKLVLFDMAGSVVAETTAAEMDVTALPVGNYLLNVYSNGNVSTVKIVIVR